MGLAWISRFDKGFAMDSMRGLAGPPLIDRGRLLDRGAFAAVAHMAPSHRPFFGFTIHPISPSGETGAPARSSALCSMMRCWGGDPSFAEANTCTACMVTALVGLWA